MEMGISQDLGHTSSIGHFDYATERAKEINDRLGRIETRMSALRDRLLGPAPCADQADQKVNTPEAAVGRLNAEQSKVHDRVSSIEALLEQLEGL